MKRTVGGATTLYLHDGGSVLSEFSNPSSGVGTWQKDYIYVGGQLLASESASDGTRYHFSDHLGTPRVVTNAAGSVVSRHDYYPYGKEITAWSDGESHKFTGKERDSESGLDYFGARFYGSNFGRFESPDAPLADQHKTEPQSWSLYTYVRNNPLMFVDPLGTYCVSADGGKTYTDDGKGGQSCAEAFNNPQRVTVKASALSTEDMRVQALAAAINSLNVDDFIYGSYGISVAVGVTGGAAYYGASSVLAGGGSAVVTNTLTTGGALAPLLPELGNKLNFLFGLAQGAANSHNVQRSLEMMRQLQRIGLPDTQTSRAIVEQHLGKILNDPTNIVKVEQGGRVVRESFLMGPQGGVKLESVWEGAKLITINVFGGG